MRALLLPLLFPLAVAVLPAQAPAPDQQRNPLAGNPAAVTAGQRLYTQTCQSCHGGNAGGSDRAPSLANSARSDNDLFQTIRFGIAGTQMSPFPGLSSDQVWQLVTYVRSVSAAPRAAGAVRTSNVDSGGGLTFERLRNAAAEPQNWLTYWGDYQGRHFSGLKQIDASNVRRLQATWTAQMPGDSIMEATPLVVDGIMYTSGMPGQVFALDAKTGAQIWRYQRRQVVVPPGEINRFNRGVAMLGNRIFVGTLDAALIALDAKTGQVLWQTQVGDALKGYSLTSAPLALKDKIIVGVAGGEFGVSGFLDAYDPATGKRLWRFNTIPGPGEPGHETWKGDSWQRGGSPAWLTGSYDPDSDVLYWTIGNPGPDIDADVRSGDNLYSCSVIALDPATGRRKWHYQFTPGDSHDWDATEDVMLIDRTYRGAPRKLLLQANRNGFFYALDRSNGQFLSATPFVRQTWNNGFDDKGRPKMIPGSESRPEGSIPVYPSLGGGTNWQAPSYSPDTGWVYVETQESGQRFTRSTQQFEQGRQYQGGRGQRLNEPSSAAVKALDPETGATKWEFPMTRGSLASGVLATAGGVVFVAAPEGALIGLDARTGKQLWRFQTGGTIASSPISYSVEGRQFVAIAAGNVLYTFGLPE